jgi:ElaB/YqjD/DUF883 family membrane-anchored ribosome-binding protein
MNPNIHEATHSAAGYDERKSTRAGERVARAADRGRIELARLREAGKNVGAQIEEQVQKRPHVVIGAAAGLGFVAGSLFGSRLGQVLLAAGLGYVARNFVEGGDIDRLREGLERLAREPERSKG